MDDRIIRLAKERYISLTTYRRDGRAVATPVWFVLDGTRTLVQTDASSGKAKRIRANGRAEVSACDMRGRTTGPPFSATARVLPPREAARARQLLARKYRLSSPLVDLWHSVAPALRGKPRTVEAYVEITLT